MTDHDLPLELKRGSNHAILTYYRDLHSQPTVVSRRCRVMLLGNGGVGKTTLAQRLVHGRPSVGANTATTHGVLQRRCHALVPLILLGCLASRFWAQLVIICVGLRGVTRYMDRGP